MTPSTATISKDQRDGLYALVRNHLGGLSESSWRWSSARTSTPPSASAASSPRTSGCWRHRLAAERDGRESVALTMPLGELSELLQRLQDEAERLLTESPAERRSREEDEETNRDFRLGLDACEGVLADLDREGG